MSACLHFTECEEGAVRFGSEGTTYGDVLTEICAVGRWTTVCIPLNQYEANDYRDTVCQQLGFSGSRMSLHTLIGHLIVGQI